MKTSMPLMIVSVLFVVSAPAVAEPITLDAKPVRVSMFKNGLAMVTTRTEVPGEGTFQVPMPEARYGSLWLSWGAGLSLENIISTESTRSEQVNTLSVRAMLEANVGKTFSIPGPKKGEWQTVTLLSMPTAEVDTEIQTFLYSEANGYDGPWAVTPASGDLMLIRTEQGIEARHPNSITRIRFTDDQAITTTTKREMAEPVLRFDSAKAGGEGGGLELNYLAQRIAWSPSYVVELLDDESVRVTCKAVVVNDLTDLKNVDVELIAGYPNIQFAETPSAMGRVPLDELLESLMESGRSGAAGVMGNRRVSRQSGRGYFGNSDSESPSLSAEPVAGEGAEDLYFYQISDVTLAKGERGYFPLLSADVPAASDVYTWVVADYADTRGRSQPDETQQVVWHSLELTNTTEQPWTTAPAMTVKDGRVLGQDTLRFVPPGGSTLLKITQAVSIDAQHNEFEIERERNAETFHGNTYDKVTIEGVLKITNHKEEPATLRISKTVTGEVVSADGEPKVVKVVSGLRGVNPRSRLAWEVEVKPGAEEGAEVMYRYSFYTR
jgi:hypothetical protein